ncbi:hypothetical protein E6C55_03275 [Cohnella fermenti]|uniref:Phage tail tape measure protein domain-containing protein n=2 Tax=Cohnella fermenti TaxID=2565925 RepID=A0A4S4C8N1_9BACL|nr:hypothetical protein E6C55_03275 [Cohnella fermenti]
MAQIQASTGASESQMQDFSKITESLYNKNLGENWYDLAEAVGTVRQVTQMTGDELEATTKNAIAYRDTFGEDITESIKAADTMMKNFGITSDQAYNLLAQGAQKGLNKSGELLDTANEYSPYFAKLGFSAESMFDTFAAGLEAGAFNLDKVGDGIKEFGIRTKDGSQASLDAYKALGLSGAQMTAQFAAGGETAQKAFLTTAKAIAAVKDPVKQNAVAVQLFGTQAEDLEARVIGAYANVEKQFDSTKNTMEQVANVKYDTLSKAFGAIGRTLQTGLILPMTKALLPVAQQFAGWVTDKMPAIQKAFGSIGPVISQIADKISGLWSGVGGGEAVSLYKDYFFDIMDTAKEFAAAIAKTWKKIEPQAMSVVSSIGSIIKQVIPIVFKLAGAIQQIGRKIISSIAPIVSYLLQKMLPIWAKVYAFIAQEVMPAISVAITALLPKIMTVVDKIGAMISAIFNAVKPFLDGIFAAFEYAWPAIKDIVMTAIKMISGVIDGLLTTLGGVIDFITGVFSGDWGKAWEGVRSIFEGIFSTLGSVLAAPINLAIDLINKAIQKVNKISFDIPDFLGGGTFGVNIPELQHVGGYAAGGYVTKPELAWVGEGGSNEWIIPENNSQRSRDLWQAAGQSIGATTDGSGSGGDFHFSPTYNFYGAADQQAVEQMEQRTRSDFRKEFEAYKAQQRRVSFA